MPWNPVRSKVAWRSRASTQEKSADIAKKKVLSRKDLFEENAMGAKDLKFSAEARDKMLRGIDTLASAVRVTLGPKGRNVALDKSFGLRVTKDGVTVANEIQLVDEFENMGARMVKEVASKTSYLAGDGTTTATVLAHGIVKEGTKAVAAGMNPMDLKRGVDLAVDAVLDDLNRNSKKVTSSDEIAQVRLPGHEQRLHCFPRPRAPARRPR